MNYNWNLIQNPLIFWPIIFWSLFWKGIALWRAARKNQKHWFVALLVINSLGILEIIYLFVFGKKKKENPIENEK